MTLRVREGIGEVIPPAVERAKQVLARAKLQWELPYGVAASFQNPLSA